MGRLRCGTMKSGTWRQDAFGIHHYQPYGGIRVDRAITHAAKTRPIGVAFFWHNSRFTPLLPDDTPAALAARWERWGEKQWDDPAAAIERLEEGKP